MYIIYKTDVWHTFKSREMIAICTQKRYVLPIVRRQAENEDSKLDRDQISNLETILQTQGYEGPGEFLIEKIQANTLL